MRRHIPALLGFTALTITLHSCKRTDRPAEQAASSPASAARGELVYVTNEDSRDLTVIDAGTDSIGSALINVLQRRSTAPDNAPDSAPVDMGYHYPR